MKMGFFVCLRVTCSFSRFVHVNPMCFDPDDFCLNRCFALRVSTNPDASLPELQPDWSP